MKVSDDLIKDLRELSSYKNSDTSLGDDAADEIERLRAELAEKDAAIAQAYEDGRISACNAGKPGCPRAVEWQPIETAPKDGTWFLAISAGRDKWTGAQFRPAIVMINPDGNYVADDISDEYAEATPSEWPLTHWMPLPEAKDFVISCQRVESDRPRAKLAASEAACAPFLKDGETPAECIARWRGEALAVLELLRQERVRSEKAEAACAQMREALQGLEDWLADCDDPELVDDYDRACGAAAAALATDAGRGWVSTEGAVEAVPSYVFNTDYASVCVVRLPAAWASGPVLIIPKPEDKP